MKKNILKIVFSQLLLQGILAVSNLVIPKLILMTYGSTVNGLINSITQFLTYAALVEAGIGNAAIPLLYNPLALKDYTKVNQIVSCTRIKYLQAGGLYLFLSIAFSTVYAFFVRDEVTHSFVIHMVFVIALSYSIDYLVIGKYKVLLIASQRYYVLNLFKIITTFLTIILSSFFLITGYSILIVKLVAVLIRILEAIGIAIYVKKKFMWINYRNKNRLMKIPQQKNALVHRIMNVIIYNTDLVVLTVFLKESLKEVSVYTIYAMPFSLITNLLVAFTDGVLSYIGNMRAKNEKEHLKRFINEFEYWYYIILFVLFTCYIVLAVPFVFCYTRGISDVNYNRVSVAVLFGISGILCQIHDPMAVMISAAGKFAETQNYIIVEAVVNLLLSVILVERWGIQGVLIGTCIGHALADVGVIFYTNSKIVNRENRTTFFRIIRNMAVTVILILIEFPYFAGIDTWYKWIIGAMIGAFINMMFFMLINVLFERSIFYRGVGRVVNTIISR